MKQLFIGVGVVCLLGVGGALANEHGHPHHAFPKDVDAFHAALAPVWHSEAGKGRLLAACAKADELASLANGISSTDASQLINAVAGLKAKCQGDQGAVEGALGKVHDEFHHLIERKQR